MLYLESLLLSAETKYIVCIQFIKCLYHYSHGKIDSSHEDLYSGILRAALVNAASCRISRLYKTPLTSSTLSRGGKMCGTIVSNSMGESIMNILPSEEQLCEISPMELMDIAIAVNQVDNASPEQISYSITILMIKKALLLEKCAR